MNSKDNKVMCGSVDYNNGIYGDVDDGLDFLNMLEIPENLEGDGCISDWALNLGPIPTEIFPEATGVGNGFVKDGRGGSSADFMTECCGMNVKEKFKSQFKQHPSTLFEDKKMYRIPKSFEAPSPDSVLERRISTSTGKTKTIPLGPEITIPVKPRSNRSRPISTANSWSKSLLLVPFEKMKKKKKRIISQSQQPVNENKKCSHCEITTTPQWREGPMGPKTLCNACGVRYRSGRLYPEYRPAASPTFIPSLHSNNHRKVIEIRQKGGHNYDVKNPNPNPLGSVPMLARLSADQFQ